MYCIPQILSLAGKKRVTIALSMGADSVAIAHFLITKKLVKHPIPWHFNHVLRPQNELMVSKFFEFCESLALVPYLESRNEGFT